MSLYAVCALVWVFLLLVFVEETVYLLKRLPADQKSPTLFVLAAYPVRSLPDIAHVFFFC